MKQVIRTLTAVAVVAAIGATATARSAAAPRIVQGAPADYIVVHSVAVTVPAGTQRHGVVNCGGGRVVLDGGATVTAALGDVYLNGSYPLGNAAWGVDVNNENLVDATFDVWAVCAKQNSSYSIVQSPFAIAVDAGTQGLGVVVCPAGTKVLGGGGSPASTDTTVNLNSSYPAKKKVASGLRYSWKEQLNNASAAQVGLTSYAICGKERGYSFVKGAAVSNPAGQTTAATATCPGVTVPIGGGLSSNTINVDTNLIDTAPASTGWTSHEGNGDTVRHKITPYVICAGT